MSDLFYWYPPGSGRPRLKAWSTYNAPATMRSWALSAYRELREYGMPPRMARMVVVGAMAASTGEEP